MRSNGNDEVFGLSLPIEVGTNYVSIMSRVDGENTSATLLTPDSVLTAAGTAFDAVEDSVVLESGYIGNLLNLAGLILVFAAIPMRRQDR